MDPAELEQFRQFQQFQDYLKFTQAQQGNQPAPPPDAGLIRTQYPAPQQGAAQPPAIPPGYQLVPADRGGGRSGPPRWVKWLGKKVIAWVLAIVILGLAGTWLYNHYFPNDAGKTSAQLAQEGGGQYRTNHILSTKPYEAVRAVYDAIAKNNPDPNSQAAKTCSPMREDIQQKFADDMGYSDCRTAALELHKKVTSLHAYQESIPSYVSEDPRGDSFVVSSCRFGIKGGPPLGAFTVTKVEMGQWLITGHSNEPVPCPPPAPTPTS